MVLKKFLRFNLRFSLVFLLVVSFCYSQALAAETKVNKSLISPDEGVKRWQREKEPKKIQVKKETAKEKLFLEFKNEALKGEIVSSLPVIRTAIGEDRNKEVWLVYGGHAKEIVAELSNNPGVKHIFQPDIFRIYPLALRDYLNDPLVPLQWGLEQTGLEEALYYLSQKQHSFSPVTLIIVDDGVWDQHKDLSGLVSERIYCDLDGCETGDTLSAGSHGTHVAGLAAALTNNTLGVASPNLQGAVKIISIRVFDLLEESASGVHQAIDYIYNNYSNRGKVVVNLSLGGCYDDPAFPQDQKQQVMQFEQEQFNRLWSAGILTFASAGNSGAEVEGGCPPNSKNYPAAYDNVISVGSLGPEGTKSGFSQYGDWVDVTAPGGDQTQCEALLTQDEIDRWLAVGCSGQEEPNITPECAELNQKIDSYLECLLVRGMISTISPTSENNYRIDDYDSFNGTSMSSPFAAGVAALVWSLNSALTNTQVGDVLFNTAEKVTGTGSFWHYGKVSIIGAVKGSLEGVSLPTATPSPISTLTSTPVPIATPTQGPGASPTSTPVAVPTATPTLRPIPTAIPSGVDPRDWCLKFCPGITFVKGDANCDGQINNADYQIWLNQFGRNVYLPGNIIGLADFDCDGKVTLSDFELWRRSGEK